MTYTAWVVIGTVLFLVAWDIVSVIHGGFQATISWLIYQVSKNYPIIPFAVGLLCGHFFWSQVC